MHFKYIILR